MKRIGSHGLPSSPFPGGLATSDYRQTATKLEFNNEPSTPLQTPRIHLYKNHPQHKITLHQFERLGLARLRLLRLLEHASLQSIRDEQIMSEFERQQAQHLPLHSNESAAMGIEVQQERLNDLASHFILRLVFSDSPDSTRFFIQNELTLLRLRFIQESPKEKEAFIDSISFPFQSISEEVVGDLRHFYPGFSDASLRSEIIGVPFELVPDLLSRANHLLRHGLVYINRRRDAFSAISTLFKSHIESMMERTPWELANLPDSVQEQIQPLISRIRHAYQHNPYTLLNTSEPSPNDQTVTLANVDSLSQHFPPCMSAMYQQLKQKHHLKYHGRQQLSLFLKSINMSLPEALQFWKQAFRLPEDTFNKQYAYNIRHNYGQEGKRANYTCPPCTKMISSGGESEGHGCPLKHNKRGDELQRFLEQQYSQVSNVEQIVETARTGQCQQACSLLLNNLTHQQDTSNAITTPIHFYQTSLRHFLNKNNTK